jgi:hypothetical protein
MLFYTSDNRLQSSYICRYNEELLHIFMMMLMDTMNET